MISCPSATTCIAILLPVTALLVKDVNCLTTVSLRMDAATATARPMAPTRLYASNDEGEDDDDDDMEDVDLGDWRKFRASLIDTGISTGEEEKNKEKESKPSVADKNEQLLEKQNAQLAEEYRSGVWAHTTGEPEVGGLLCRMPLEAELFYGEKGYWKKQLTDTLQTKNNQDNLSGAARVAQWFQTAEKMVLQELQAINNSGKIKDGVLNPNDLEEKSRIMLNKYINYKDTWQEVCLVLSHQPGSGYSESVVINRPICKSIDRQLAQILIEGADSNGGITANFDFEFTLVDKVVLAFGDEAGVYMGGVEKQGDPAVLIHGIPGLKGAQEISPGTGIYQGGLQAAVDGVINGLYKPLDFRFFLGRKIFDPKEFPENGTLLQKVGEAAYKPVACARSVALKQCLGLPKPLWHEVLELCGGEMKYVSSIELKKRADLESK